jgi:hypothetical protein
MTPPVTDPAAMRRNLSSFGLAATLVAIPGSVAVFNTVLAAVLYSAEVMLLLAVMCTAVFIESASERAFRLLRWMTGRPEPAATPTDALPGPDDSARTDRITLVGMSSVPRPRSPAGGG